MKPSFRKSLLLIVFSLAILPFSLKSQSSITAVFQPGPENGNDAMYQNLTSCSSPINSHNTNYGDNNILMARAWSFNSIPENCNNGVSRSLIRFDGLNTLPDDALVVSATLCLYGLSASENGQYGNSYPELNGGPSNPIKIGRVLSNWDESSLTWTNQPSVDFSDNIQHGPSTQRFSENITIDVSAIVQSQISGENNGLGIQLLTESLYRSWYWASNNFSNPQKRPKLIVEYQSAPCQSDFSYTYNTADTSFTFKVNPPLEGSSYQWTFGDGNTALATDSPVAHTYDNAGSYTVCLMQDHNESCQKCIDICVTEDQAQNNTVSVGNIDFQRLRIENLYPNPTHDQISLELVTLDRGSAEVTVYDLTGKMVVTKSYFLTSGKQKITLMLPELNAGIYICSILFDGSSVDRKFVVG